MSIVGPLLPLRSVRRFSNGHYMWLRTGIRSGPVVCVRFAMTAVAVLHFAEASPDLLPLVKQLGLRRLLRCCSKRPPRQRHAKQLTHLVSESIAGHAWMPLFQEASCAGSDFVSDAHHLARLLSGRVLLPTKCCDG
eukprot:5455819-Amphidinium_carterae.1